MDLLRGLTWASNSCPFNWDTKGALSLTLYSESPTTDRFNHILLTGLASGDIVIERVPMSKYASKKYEIDPRKLRSFRAHLGGVAGLSFIDEGARLVTCGSCDGTLRVWKVNYDTDEFEPDPVRDDVHPMSFSLFDYFIFSGRYRRILRGRSY